MKISVIIKALNEEEKIARCIESTLAEIAHLEHEVIVVDSISEDRTIEIAKNYPVKIVQFKNIEDRSCGAAPQLGYQVATGDLIYLLDGDMEMAQGFLDAAILYLNDNADVAGVGGKLVDRDISSALDHRRMISYQHIKTINSVESLGGGGIYRRSAIESVGYFSHRTLKACEELELGLRLKKNGWKLVRLPIVSVFHTGHKLKNYSLLSKYLKTGRLGSHGVLIHTSFNKKWFYDSLYENKPIMLVSFTLLICAFTLLFFSISTALLTWLSIWVITFLFLTIKKKSFSSALFSVISWNLIFWESCLHGCKSITSPYKAIEYRIIQ